MKLEEENEKRYFVQTGTFMQYYNARNQAYPLMVIGYPVHILKHGDYYVVQVGPVATLEESHEIEGDLISLGYDTLLVQG